MVAMMMLAALATPGRPANVPTLLEAIRMQESSGIDRKVGDGGRAKGPFQIWRPYWDDACRFGGVSGQAAWRYDRAVWDRAKSQQVVRWYWQMYCPAAYANGDLEVLARVHNGGPKGHVRPSTLPYWTDVKRRMARR